MASFSKPRSSGIVPMLVALFLFLQVTAAIGHAHKSPQEMKRHYQEMKHEIERRQAQTDWHSGRYIRIEGVNPSSPAPRLEIRELQKNTDQWNLYLLGMQRFMNKPKTDKVGFYQIAGVHGRPYIGWNNFTPINTAGFCPHAQTLFSTWHRPYLAVFEQALHLSIQEVINEFPTSQQTRLRNAARTLRMPYWDWAMDGGSATVPTSMRDKTVSVNGPRGQVTINNPLYSYTWGSTLPAEMLGGPYNNFATTLRRPVANPTRSNNNEMNARFNTLRVSLRDRIYNLFAARPVPSFGSVATSQIGARNALNVVDSFESIHDPVHNTAGGESGGHMYYLDYSAFEPLFWLHHTNVDRLLAMYQVTTPNTFVSNARITRPMAQWNAGEPKNAYTPLKPFTKNANGDYFTSMDVKQTTVLGYYYPETRSNNAADVYSAVSRLYGPGRATLRKRDGDDYEPIQYQGRQYQEGEDNYVLNIIANRYALDGSYDIHCFLENPHNGSAPYPIANGTAPAAPAYPTASGSPSYGSPSYGSDEEEPDVSPDDYTQNPNYIGNYGILGMTHADKEYKVMTSGVLPLTTALQGKHAAGYLPSLCREEVEQYLKKYLSCKIINGQKEMPADEIPDLHFGVKACPVKPPKNPGEMPEMGDYVDIPSITEDWPAGQPYKHELTPLETVTEGEYVPEGPNGEKPDDEEGYCVTKQTIRYVDPDGNFLYEEKA